MTTSLLLSGAVGWPSEVVRIEAPLLPMQTASGTGMRNSREDHTQDWVIDVQILANAWRRMYPTKTAQMVAHDVKAPARTVEKWLSGEAKPSFDYWGKILNRYGLGFVVSGMTKPLPHLDDLAREERKAFLMAERQRIDAMLAEDFDMEIAR